MYVLNLIKINFNHNNLCKITKYIFIMFLYCNYILFQMINVWISRRNTQEYFKLWISKMRNFFFIFVNLKFSYFVCDIFSVLTIRINQLI